MEIPSNKTTGHNSVSQILARLFTIHDLLPSRKGLRGLKASDIQQRLEALGFDVDTRTVQRDMIRVESLFFVESDKSDQGEHLWRRSHQENLCSRLRPGAGLE